MKSIHDTFSNEQAQRELKKSAMYAWPFIVVAIFIVSWIALGGIYFGSKGFMLTYHRANKDNRKLLLYRILTGLLVVIGAFEVIWFLLHI